VANQVIGFCGAFGSGCSTAASTARDLRTFVEVSLSDVVKSEYARLHPADPKGYKRSDLQQLGDAMRETHGGDVLARQAVDSLGPKDLITIDGIRNTAEIRYLRERFGYAFTLVAVLAPVRARWARLAKGYGDGGQTEADFHADDRRDRDEDAPHGQQVDLCVDASDVFIDNAPPLDQEGFRAKIVTTIDLITGAAKRYPTNEEVMMHMAFSSAHGSKCLKRHVGAVIADTHSQVVSVGYNENPLNTKPCALEAAYGGRCFRDKVREEHFISLTAQKASCPRCAKPIPLLERGPWICPNCKSSGTKTNLEDFFFPDRAMSWCTAIHAEAAAIVAAAERSRGGTLYSTTFPCF
jgi:deoxycytidylate deaminase